MQLSQSFGVFEPEIEGIHPDTILRIHGYKEPNKVKPIIRDTAQTMLSEGLSLFDPVIYFRKIGIKSLSKSHLELQELGITLDNPEFGDTLAGCSDIVVFLLTLGYQPDHRSTELQAKDDLLEAVFLETACWLGIERATRCFVEKIRSITNSNDCRITKRLAPGYKDWVLTDQRKIFALFDGKDIGIELLEGDCMKPKMSRSGMYGIAPNPRSN